MLLDILQNGCSQFGDSINGVKLDIKGIQSEVKDLESWDFIEEDQWIFEQSEESFSEFVSAGNLLVDEELGEVTDDVLKLYLERAALLIEHFT